MMALDAGKDNIMRKQYDNSTVSIGDYIIVSWGATMTLHDFYQVIAINGRTQVTVQSVEKEIVPDDKPFCNGARIKQPVNTYGAMERHYVRRVNTVNGEHYVIDFNKYQHGFKIDDVNHVYIENTCGN